MVDILALTLSHGLLLLAAWRLLSRPELDVEVRGESAGEIAGGSADPSPSGHRPKRVMRTGRRDEPESDAAADA